MSSPNSSYRQFQIIKTANIDHKDFEKNLKRLETVLTRKGYKLSLDKNRKSVLAQFQEGTLPDHPSYLINKETVLSVMKAFGISTASH